MVCGDLAATVHFVRLLWETPQISGTMCFTNNKQNRNIPAEPNPNMRKLWYLCSNLYAMNNMSAKPCTLFPRDGHRTAENGTEPIVNMTQTTKMKWPSRSTIQCSMVS